MKETYILLERRFIGTILIYLIAIQLTACNFTEIPVPSNQLITSSTFADNSTATAALTSIYTQMVGKGPNLCYYVPFLTGLSGDELTNYSTETSYIQFYRNSINATDNTMILSLWSNLYNLVYQTNAVIEGINQSEKLDKNVKRQLMGEAKFIRAFLNFQLVNFWGDIPLATSTDYRINTSSKRLSEEVVYKQILEDLREAQAFLNIKYVDKTDTAETNERVRPTKWAADALLSKVSLYIGDWKTAESEATKVLNNTILYTLEDLDKVFLKNSKEAIWQIMTPQPNSIGTYEAYFFVLTDGPTTGQYNCSTISTHLENAFETGDRRKTVWISTITDGTNSFSYPSKYKEQYAAIPSEYSTVLRTAEVYLIRAEAMINQGKIHEGISDLNMIRRRAGLADTTLTTKVEALKAIYHERQVELFTEWGNRWFDLKRTKTIDKIMPTVTIEKGGIWMSNKKLYPIPQSEINSNPNLSQNLGY